MHDLTSKERELLGLYVEGYACEPRYLAYPAQIEKDTHHQITRAWAGKICRDFENRHVFRTKSVRPPRQKHNTESYFLSDSKEAFLEVARLFLGTGSANDAFFFLQSPYCQSILTEKFVKIHLYEKGVTMTRTLHLSDWKGEERDIIMKKYTSQLENLSLTRYREMMHKQNKKLRIPALALVLPVFPDAMTIEMMASHLLNINEHEFIEYDLKENWSGLEWHYEQHERYHLILPILSLIQLSPAALGEFLFGDWLTEGEEVFDDAGLGKIEGTLFRLLFKGLGDLSQGMEIPESSIVYDYFIRPRESPGTVLSVILKDYATDILFDGGWEEGESWLEIQAIRIREDGSE
jgi:hypothetical protein